MQIEEDCIPKSPKTQKAILRTIVTTLQKRQKQLINLL